MKKMKKKKKAAAVLERDTLQTSVRMDYFTERQLTAKSGYEPHEWPEMIVKELVDNGIDACEAAGISPKIKVSITKGSITVSDNGPGMPESTIEASIDYETRVSDKSKIPSPTRGSQGEAYKQIYAVPYVLGGGSESHVEISVKGKRHNIIVRTDEIEGKPCIEITNGKASFVKNGTNVKVYWPKESSLLTDCVSSRFLPIAEGYALVNPHLDLEIESPQGNAHYRPSNKNWEKHLPTTPTSPYWWMPQDITAYIGALIAHDMRIGRMRTMREFLAQFSGLSSTAKQKAVLKSLGLTGALLTDLVSEDGGSLNKELIRNLLRAMKRESRKIKPGKLGVIGEKHFRKRFGGAGAELSTFKYKCIKGFHGDLPYVIEVAFACHEDGPHIIGGVNWTPSVKGIPFGQIGDNSWNTLDTHLQDRFCGYNESGGYDEPVMVAIHLAIPNANWTDQGKTRMSLQGEVAESCLKGLDSVTRDWVKQGKAQKRESARAWREEIKPEKKKKGVSLKDAIFQCMDEGIDEASSGGNYRIPTHNLFYSIRHLIQPLTQEHLTKSYFVKVLDQYEEEHGPIQGLTRDPRGHMIEPHTGKVIPLGTVGVDEYDIPENEFDKILYVEKKGFWDIFQKAQIAEKYDIAIVCAEGYAVRAARLLLSAAQTERKMTVLCLHDADPYGYMICKALRDATASCPIEIDVRDIGLGIDEAIEMGLKPEHFIRKRALPQELQLTDSEREYFTGEEHKDRKRQVDL